MSTDNIVTLTMNPAIDTSVSVNHIMTDHKIRCLKAHRDPGGGGLHSGKLAGVNQNTVFLKRMG